MKKIIYSLSVCFLLFNSSAIAQLPGWTYKNTITVQENSGVDLYDYQLKLTFATDALISAGKMNPDGSDIRIGKDASGNTLLNYWLEGPINSPNTVIWIKVDSLLAGQSKNLYLFYGNNTALSTSTINVFSGPSSSTDSVASGGAGGATNSQRGFRFSPNEDVLVTHFGKREPNGTTRYVTLFDFTTNAIVKQIQVSGPAAEYSYDTIGSPIWLTQNTQYLLELYQGATDGYYFGSSSQIGQALTYYDMRYCNSCTQNTFPTQVLGGYQYGYPDLWYYTKQNIAQPPTVNLVLCSVNPVCQNATIYLDVTGNATLTALQIDNGSSSSCAGIATITVSPSIFTCSNAGINTVTLVVTDSIGNIDSCTSTVTVLDTTKPFISCNPPSAALYDNGPFISGTGDGFGGANTSAVIPPISTLGFGHQLANNNRVEDDFTITNPSGWNIDSISFYAYQTGSGTTSTMNNVNLQIWNGPPNGGGSVVWGNTTTNLLVSSVFTGVYRVTSTTLTNNQRPIMKNTVSLGGVNLAPGTYWLDWQTGGTLASGPWAIPITIVGQNNTGNGLQSINGSIANAIDAGSGAQQGFPFKIFGSNFISSGLNDTIYNNTGVCEGTIALPVPLTSDNCSGIASLTNNFNNTGNASGNYPVGTTTVLWTVTDANSNTNTCQQIVTVIDTTKPTAVCASPSVYLDASGNATITVAQVNGGSFDNCGVLSTSISTSNFTCANIGANAVTLVVTDSSGNVDSCVATITVLDTIFPSLTCPSNITVSNDFGICGAVVNFSVSGTDNCSGVIVVSSVASGSTFPIGTTTVNDTATDASGNVSVCSFTVTVNDTTKPTLVCPANITVSNDLDSCGAIVNFSVTASDSCGIASVVSSYPSGFKFPVGTTTVYDTAIDIHGNTSTCSFTVTVNDTTKPTLVCPANITVSNDLDSCGAIVNFSVTASDNCGIASAVSSYPSGFKFPVGTTTVYDTAIDIHGNTSTCSFTVTVNDTTKPTQVCPANITVSNDLDSCGAIVNFSITASDNCGIASAVSSYPSGFTFPVGTTTVYDTAIDIHGNTSTCSFTITVNDTTKPTLVCPANITVSNDSGICGAVINFSITASDNCGIASAVSSYPSGFTFPVGTTTVYDTAIDIHGNTSTCSFTVTVNDTTKPTLVCPANITVSNDSGICGAVINFSITASDNCGIASAVSSYPSGFTFPVGTTTVYDTAIDIHGNTSTCSFTVTVNDTTKPTVICKNITTNLDSTGNLVVSPSQIDNSSFDNCSIKTYILTPNKFNCSNIGANSVTLTVIDSSGNFASCVASVTILPSIVVDSVVLSNYNGVNVSCFGGNDGTATAYVTALYPSFYSWSNGDVTAVADSLSAQTYTVTITSGGCIDSSTVSLNQPSTPVSAIANVISNYNNAEISCYGASDGAIKSQAFGGLGGYTYSWNTNPVQVSSTASGLPDGAYVVIATDINGCSASATDTLNQPDSILIVPTVSNYNGFGVRCFGSNDGIISLAVTGGTGTYTYTWPTSSGVGNVSINNALTAGIYAISVTDINGCIKSKSPELTSPTQLATSLTSTQVSCFGSNNGQAIVVVNGGAPTYTYSWNSTPTQTDDTATALSPGNYNVTVQDANGCATISSVSISQPSKLGVSATGEGVTCTNGNDGKATAVATGATPPYVFNWNSSPVQTTANATQLSPGTYQVIVKDGNGCTDSTQVIISVKYPTVPTATLSGGGTACAGSPLPNVAINFTGFGPYNFTLNNGSIQQSFSGVTQNPLLLSNLAIGTYTLTNYSDAHCPGTISGSASIVVNPNPQGVISGGGFVCNGDKLPSIDIALTGTPNFQITYGRPNASDTTVLGISTLSYTIAPLVEGFYTVRTITDGNGCTVSNLNASLEVGFHLPPIVDAGPSQTIDKGFSAKLAAEVITANGGAVQYLWSPDSTLSNPIVAQPFASPFSTTLYTLVATDKNGCSASDTVTVTVSNTVNVDVINVFTPDGDGVNEFFVIRNLAAYKNLDLTVVNRWGNIIYQNDNYQNDWDGTWKGKPSDDGTYYYVIKEPNSGKTIKGPITILRTK
jgi:gliding motility-associated-like protein